MRRNAWCSRARQSSILRYSRTSPAGRHRHRWRATRHVSCVPTAPHRRARPSSASSKPRKHTGSHPTAPRHTSSSSAEQTERIVTKTGMAPEAARRTVERQCDGVLLPLSCCRSMTRIMRWLHRRRRPGRPGSLRRRHARRSAGRRRIRRVQGEGHAATGRDAVDPFIRTWSHGL